MPPAPGPRIALLGATLTGNRGAEAMLRAAVQRIPELVPGARFTLLSLYPADDRACDGDLDLEIAALSPLQLVAIAAPLALLAAGLARLGLPHRFCLCTAALRALDEADLVVDLSGISFVDGRGPLLLYNVLVVGIPALLGTPLVKYAQALGPFRRPLNRWCAQRLLPRVARIAARGARTRAHLEELALPEGRVVSCADAAFALRVEPRARRAVEPLLASALFQRPVVAVSASSVVDALCRRRGIDYRGLLADWIRHLVDERGYGVCLVAHSARPGRSGAKNNDLPVCRAIAAAVARPECVLPETAYDAEALRALIGACRYLVASRFHAMVSGLAAQVPTLQISWSHKYVEVLEDFGLEDRVIDCADLDARALREGFEGLERDDAAIRERIRTHLPRVVDSSLDNARLAAEALRPPATPAAA